MLMIRVLSLTIDKSPIFIANNGNYNYELKKPYYNEKT